MFPSDHPAVTHKEDLYNRDLTRLIHGERDHVPVISVVHRDLLTFSDRPDTLNQVPVGRGFLKAQLFRGLLHLCCKIFDFRIRIPVQEFHRGIDLFPVILGAHRSLLARRVTLADMVIQAGPLLPLGFRKLSRTRTKPVQFPYQLDHIFHSPCRRIGAVVF